MADGPTTFRDHFLSVYQSAAAEVARRAEHRLSGPPGAVGPRLARAGEAANSIEQSAAEAARRYFEAHRRQVDAPPGAFALPARSCAELGLRFLEAKLRKDTVALAKLESEFKAGACDPAWATTLTEYARFFGPDGTRGTIPYIPPSQIGDRVIEIKAGAKIALVADWGTGAAPALQILGQIAKLNPDIFIHLGDVYYSGTPRECDLNFQRPLEAVLGTDRVAIPAYALAGNHDMYCGGSGYYNTIANLNPEPFRQRASFFCLRSSDQSWQLLAMDTGLHDFAPLSVEDALTRLDPDELEWHSRRVEEFSGRTILLSHHQLFSAFSSIGPVGRNGQRNAVNPNLAAVLTKLDVNSKIAAWFWGHEHNLCIYNRFAGLERGRCIGHGAVPVFGTDNQYAPLDDLSERPTLVENTKLQISGDVWAHGFALLTLGTDANSTLAQYYQDLNGQASLVYFESIR